MVGTVGYSRNKSRQLSANAVVLSTSCTYCALVTVIQPSLNRWWLAREVAFPVVGFVAIVGCAEMRMPLGLPGHRGLIWLTVLVAVTLMTYRRETVIAVGAASTAATVMLQVSPGPWGGARYLEAAVLLYAVAAVPVVRRRRWLLVLAAAPIHLVALAGSVPVGMGEKALFHVAFGLGAGLLGGAIAVGMGERLWGPHHR